uniref:ARAD1A08272p n=1 Tax=Blastobotrys adeninivorans TaxID=409370 RepID=A0A060T3B1_BLAAD
MVKQYASVTKHLEDLIAQIPAESISDCLKSDAVTRAIELVAISQQDRQSPYFQRPIVKEYFGEEDSYRWLGFLANSDMDMEKLCDLKRQADQLVDQLEDKVDKVKV